jgi:isochorismate synthase
MMTEASRATVVARGAPPRLASTTRAIPLVDPIDAFAAAGDASRALWLRPATNEALVGLGCAFSFSGGFDAISAGWQELLSDAAIDQDGPAGPLLMGGFSFDPSAPTSALWEGFGAAQLVLPERLIRVQSNRAWLTTSAVAEPLPAEQPVQAMRAVPSLGLNPDDWRDLVSTMALGMRTGHLGVRKVVLARSHQIEVRRPLPLVLRQLAAEYPACTIFAFAKGDACFLGATPERLVSLHDGIAATMALAGSGPRGKTPEQDRALADRLLADPKERAEHDVVVQAMREGLAPVCTRVVADAEPRIHPLANVQHLITPIHAQVAAGHCVLDLVKRLHPTPAVGGYPRPRALELIRDSESLDRGWYAAPLGWVDPRGQGEFVVGLRSALVREDVSTLFAGCGIVADSDPETELTELGWKLRPMLKAFGVDG